MIALRSGERLLPGYRIVGEGLVLTYQFDGNLVVYQAGVPIWNTATFDSPGRVEMQADGNLVMYNASGVPIWATNTFGVGAILEMKPIGLSVSILDPVTLWATDPFPAPVPSPPGDVRQLVAEIRPIRRSFGDGTGPRYIYGCTDFGGIVKYHEDRDKSLRSLDVTAAHRQFIRTAYRLNGWLWTSSGLTLDPIRDGWWEESCLGYLIECNNRGLRVNFTCADMFNWTDQQANDSIARLAQIAASVSPNVVILHEWNEAQFTCPGKESDAQIEQLRRLTEVWQRHYPWNLRGLSDPINKDKAGMQRMTPSPANSALIHNIRHSAHDAIRRAFNIQYEGYPDDSITEGEPTGPNGNPPSGLYSNHVYQPTENHDDLFAIYTMHILTGQISTYFNDPALVSREPLDSTWGFKELPTLWKRMEIPENVGQGTWIHGGQHAAPLRVNNSNALRADSVEIDGQVFGIISGGSNWRVTSGRAGILTIFDSTGPILEQPIHVGEVIPASGPTPAVIRIR